MAVATRRARMYVICCPWRKEVTGDIKDPGNLDLTRINVMPFHPSSAHKLPLPLALSSFNPHILNHTSHTTNHQTIFLQNQTPRFKFFANTVWILSSEFITDPSALPWAFIN